MIWASEAPKTPGFYWFKQGERVNDMVVQVGEINGKMRFTAGVWAYPGVSVDSVSSQALWAGPIPSPLPTDAHPSYCSDAVAAGGVACNGKYLGEGAKCLNKNDCEYQAPF